MTDAPEGDVPTPTGEVVEPTPVVEDPKPEAPKTFTQEQVNRFNTKAKNEGAEAARKALAEQLGMSVEEAAALVKAHNEAKEAEKTELDKLREANEALKRESEANTTKLQQELHTDRVKLRLSRVGLALPEDKDEAEKALDRIVGLVNSPIGSSYEEIDGNIDELKNQFPNLFQAPTTQPVGNVPSNPSGTPRKPSLEAKSLADRGAELAAQANAKRGVVTPTA